MELVTVKVLLVEDNNGDVKLIQEALAGVKQADIGLERVDRLSPALDRLAAGGIDVVLLDLSLPDSLGFETITRMRSLVPEVPIVVLTGLDDEELAVEAVRAGAQDYLVKGQVSENILVKSIIYAVERQRLRDALTTLSLIDELTGLYNRRGFLTLAKQQVKLAERTKRGLLLFFADLDRMKDINDTFGHQRGDAALVEISQILTETFRSSDIISRYGGDEFAVLAVETRDSNHNSITNRLQRKIINFNHSKKWPFQLSLSIGAVIYDPGKPRSLDELLTEADKLMYIEKRSKNSRVLKKS